jgi:hypothetical protein
MSDPKAPSMRFVVEVRYTDEGVEGEVVAAGQSTSQRYSSWLELLRLLEPDPRVRDSSRG